MKFFAEAMYKMLRLHAGLFENIDLFSLVETGAGAELDNVFMK